MSRFQLILNDSAHVDCVSQSVGIRIHYIKLREFTSHESENLQGKFHFDNYGVIVRVCLDPEFIACSLKTLYAVAHDLRIVTENRNLFEAGLTEHLRSRSEPLEDLFQVVQIGEKPSVRKRKRAIIQSINQSINSLYGQGQ